MSKAWSRISSGGETVTVMITARVDGKEADFVFGGDALDQLKKQVAIVAANRRAGRRRSMIARLDAVGGGPASHGPNDG
jgi:acyl-CoA hydrolase